MGSLRTSYTNWDFVTYLNLTTYSEKFQTLNKYFKLTGDLCLLLRGSENQTLDYICEDFLQITHPFILEIQLNYNSVMRILAPENITPKLYSRRIRGLVNVVGRLANVLFGVCSDTDAEFFYSNIRNLKQASDRSSGLAREQLRIVESVVQDVNISIHDLVSGSMKMQSNIDILYKKTENILGEIDVLSIQNLFQEHTSVLSVLLNQFAWETQNLQTIVNSALNGFMHTSVYPPSDLYHELKEIQLKLPPTLELPVTENHLSVPELFRASTLSVTFIKQTLLFVTRIPLLSNIHFKLFNNIPLPIATDEGNMLIIEPQNKYLAISNTNEYYFGLSDNQYDKCISLFSFKLCLSPESIKKYIHKENCEVSLYEYPDHPVETCNFKYVSLNTTIWHKLYLQNTWLYFCKTQIITVTCRQESQKFKLSGVGKITIPDHCVIYTDNSILTPSRGLTSEIRKDLAPASPDPKFIVKMTKISHKYVPQIMDINHNYKDFNQLAKDAKHISELSEKYKDTELIVKPEHHLVIMYTMIFIIVIVSLYLMIKYKCTIPKVYLPEIAEPQIVKETV